MNKRQKEDRKGAYWFLSLLAGGIIITLIEIYFLGWEDGIIAGMLIPPFPIILCIPGFISGFALLLRSTASDQELEDAINSR